MPRDRIHRHTSSAPSGLTCRIPIRVRFSEVDSMRIVWHGAYPRYFEDSREAFGRQYPGIGYLDIHASGYTAPIVELHLQYHHPLTIGDTATVEIRHIDTPAAKLCFDYLIRRDADRQIVATGHSMQVFIDPSGELSLTQPEFYHQWRTRWLHP
ncbi:thioesterase family protein [uncultured Rikenella sp.]|uniref:acyl-CoA thioesterase n=1 Tax=uncultured Rikenella sp. TaxID=368003 RepID=UPI00261966C4|nr:acyl-CoA thioesterase [uncultured Rikenella sp.]